MSFTSGRGGHLRSGHVYQRQLATVSAATASARARSPTSTHTFTRRVNSEATVNSVTVNPPSPHHSTLHDGDHAGNQHGAIVGTSNGFAVAAGDPYRLVIMAHVRNLFASAPPNCSFSDNKLIRTLDTGMLDAATSAPIIFSPGIWKCPICIGVPRQPVTLTTCGHLYCDGCVHQLMVTNRSTDFTTHKCCNCRTHFKRNDLSRYGQWSLLSKQTWALIRVQCESCDFISSPEDMVHHERVQCPSRVVTCPGCWFSGTVEDVCNHALQCNSVLVNCIRCGYPIRHTRRDLHDCEAVLACDRRRGLIEPGLRGTMAQSSAAPVDEVLWGSDGGAGEHRRNEDRHGAATSAYAAGNGVPTLADMPALSSSSSTSTAAPPGRQQRPSEEQQQQQQQQQTRRYSTRRGQHTIFHD